MSKIAPPESGHGPASLIGITALCVAMLLMPIGDAITKSLTSALSPSIIAAARAIIQLAAFGIAALLLRRMLRGRVFSVFSLLAGLFSASISWLLITAFQTMPIATAIAIFFVEPLLLTLLAGPLLGETPGPRRYLAVAVGLLGTLLILRPNFAVFGPVVLLPLLAAFAYAAHMIVTRKAMRDTSPLSFQLGASTAGAAALIAIALIAPGDGGTLPGLTGLSGWVAAGIVTSGILVAVTFLLITFAFSRAEASILAPLQYLEILGATAIGYLAFGDIPDLLTILGTMIILGSGLYILHRERKAGQHIEPIRRDI
ncbi:DMT family transporter [Paracoccus aerodenitrificans]|uniref:DMT family transporter n=1 Tax=Paracoccus aerodenitrificans TaxID=3017781 RepID=UPI0022EFF3E7|nr:DMT family transporter [Paracoccus aerodenitrificans]WBU64024.1 DMT family transporter [Paracoccus aerodenitrificans]